MAQRALTNIDNKDLNGLSHPATNFVNNNPKYVCVNTAHESLAITNPFAVHIPTHVVNFVLGHDWFRIVYYFLYTCRA